MPGRIKKNKIDWIKFKKNVEVCINPLDTERFPKELIYLSSDKINLEKCVKQADGNI